MAKELSKRRAGKNTNKIRFGSMLAPAKKQHFCEISPKNDTVAIKMTYTNYQLSYPEINPVSSIFVKYKLRQ